MLVFLYYIFNERPSYYYRVGLFHFLLPYHEMNAGQEVTDSNSRGGNMHTLNDNYSRDDSRSTKGGLIA